jgi:hypothetical protein
MDFPRLTPKQRLANAALIAVGVAGVWLGATPRGHGALQPFELVLGITCFLCGFIATAANGWHVTLLVLALLSAIPGGIAGDLIWSFRHPEFRTTGKHPNDREQKMFAEQQTYRVAGAVLGAMSMPLAAAALSTIRRRSDRTAI